jgi:hypothetical protein
VPLNKGFLITRPRHDYLTNLIFHWCDDVLELAKSKGYRVFKLDGPKANKKVFESYVRKGSPSLVFLNGHGNSSCIMGHDNEVLVGVDDGDDLLPGSVVYARSCDAAKELAPKMISQGTKAFLGYKRKFTVASSKDRVSRPRDDKLAKLFIEPANIAPLALLKGNTVEEADRRSKAEMMKKVLYMLSSVATDEERSVASLLYSNFKGQVIVGDGTATV